MPTNANTLINIDIDIKGDRMKDKYVGTIVGSYRILERMPERDKYGHNIYKAECIKCGYITYRRIIQLKKHNLTDEGQHFSVRAHWFSVRLEGIYYKIKNRCYNKNNKAYRFYGAKGVHMCDYWLNNPQAFNDWSLENGYNEELTIDRIDPAKDYSPENCRWITSIQNSKWKSTTNKITVHGITDSGKGWARRLGIGVNAVNRWKREHGIDYCINNIKNLL